jgi:hypothetical protein
MERDGMIAKLNRKDISGVGVKVLWRDGCEIYYFYEDFAGDKGVDRAARHFENLINKGKVRKVEYFYKDDCQKTIPCCGCRDWEMCEKTKILTIG